MVSTQCSCFVWTEYKYYRILKADIAAGPHPFPLIFHDLELRLRWMLHSCLKSITAI